MAGEVTRRQQNLQVAAEDPPCFLDARTFGLRQEKANREADTSKVCSSKVTDKTITLTSKEASLWTKAVLKAEMAQKMDK